MMLNVIWKWGGKKPQGL